MREKLVERARVAAGLRRRVDLFGTHDDDDDDAGPDGAFGGRTGDGERRMVVSTAAWGTRETRGRTTRTHYADEPIRLWKA